MNTMNKFCFLLFSLVAATSCSQESATIVDKGSKFLDLGLSKIGLGHFSPTASQPAAAAPAPIIITVQEGDTLRKLSARHSIPLKDIIAANHLVAPYHLKTGTSLTLPATKYHQIAAKETLSKVARLYKISVAELITANQLSAPFKIKTGQMLRIPGNLPSPSAQMASHSTGNNGWAQPAPISATPAAYTVPVIRSKPSNYGAPRLQPASTSQTVPEASPFAQPEQPMSRAPQPASQSTPLTPLPKTRVSQHNAADTSSASTSTYDIPASTEGGKFVWPIKGTIISRFGPRKGGLYNDGINIASPEDTPVRAAADGSIVYAGNELQGYGNLIIIKHSNGMVTAYAHQKDMMVKKGDHIQRGQVIGHVGATGNVKSPQLHFGIREGEKAVDPELYLSAQK